MNRPRLHKNRLMLGSLAALALLAAGFCVGTAYRTVRSSLLRHQLIQAIRKNDPAAVRNLLAAGADPNTRVEEPRGIRILGFYLPGFWLPHARPHGDYAIDLAVEHNLNGVDQIIARLDYLVPFNGKRGPVPVQPSARTQRATCEIVHLLLAHGASPDGDVGASGHIAPLFRAEETPELFEDIVAHHPRVDDQAMGIRGCDLVYYAIDSKVSTATICRLLDLGADTSGPGFCDGGHESVLAEAVRCHRMDLIKPLKAHGARP
jgi:hypothetical protein